METIRTPRRRQVDLIHGPIFKNLFIFAIPIFISNLFQQLYNAADAMIVGNVLGDTSLAAVGACGSIYELLVGFGLGIGNGLAIVTARAYGAEDAAKVKKTVAGSVVIGLAASAIITVVGLLFLYPLLEVLDTPPEIIDEAYSYIQPIAQYVVVMFAYNLCAALLRAVGNSVMPLVFLIFSSCLNVALDYWFVAGWGWGCGALRWPPCWRRRFRWCCAFSTSPAGSSIWSPAKSTLPLKKASTASWSPRAFRWA